MNWTGGEYTKAAPTKQKALLQRQKARFARARAARTLQSNHAALDERMRSYRSSQDGGTRWPVHELQTTTPNKSCRLTKEHNSRQHMGGLLQSDCTVGADSQELRLLAKRKELLLRSDWLGLRFARPLHITFETEEEKAMIGRRRKIRRPMRDRRTMAAHLSHQPLDRPLEQEAHDIQESSSIHFRLGTDAFNTQLSRRRTSRPTQYDDQVNTSTDLLSLSEEPMLLDSDDEVFEQPEQIRPSAHEQDIDAAAERVSGLFTTVLQPLETVPSSIRPTIELSDTGRESTVPDQTSEAGCSQRATETSQEHTSTASAERERIYGKCWQKMLGIPTTSERDASNIAVRSFNASSSTSCSRPVLDAHRRRLPATARTYMASSAREPATSESMRVHASDVSSSRLESDHKSISIPASLAKLQGIARAPEKPQQRQATCDSSEAVWRQFIIGDDDNEHSD